MQLLLQGPGGQVVNLPLLQLLSYRFLLCLSPMSIAVGPWIGRHLRKCDLRASAVSPEAAHQLNVFRVSVLERPGSAFSLITFMLKYPA